MLSQYASAFIVPSHSFGMATNLRHVPPAPAAFLSSSRTVKNTLTVMPMSASVLQSNSTSSVESTIATDIRWKQPVVDDAVAEGLEYIGEFEGVRATRPFSKGEVVVHGFRVRDEEYNHSHASQVALDKWVQHGGIQSFINHACYPLSNLHPKEKIDEDGILVHDLVAIRDISVGETVTYDYCMRNLSIEHFPAKCLCGSPKCRDKIRGWSALSTEERDMLRPYSVSYLSLWEEIVEKKQYLGP
mmetsp:Transcript_7547/g.9030  ORF Transcript_7547/g.9030 Transcript_7547/m.9030 type:complete len:244 (-) Transcript_7547:241-972(-)|eukprot:CAMPEP_0195291546 /NCGR_PEP_ID=MMETSP0707-20130614/7858_1 /TAXON_ID=33640 /ORGANISM="Asterionellopsis glacialis, Strain CCMP134" /LENGTH=243 /DNA_ID=CAMNT_0040351875 /DNA_START=399 /DNA_END=1130 /DNA_ORIENTATION=+